MFSDSFLAAFRSWANEYLRKERAMADPNSAEGQKLIQEQIAQQNIDHSYQMVGDAFSNFTCY